MSCDKNYWPPLPFTFCATFIKGINRLKVDPPPQKKKILKCFHFWKKKISSFLLFCARGARECKGKDVKNISNPRFYFTDTWKNIESAVTLYINPRLQFQDDWLSEWALMRRQLTFFLRLPYQIIIFTCKYMLHDVVQLKLKLATFIAVLMFFFKDKDLHFILEMQHNIQKLHE